jgi:hypothetical protein
MALHPEAQAKARTELDAVVGRGRLPEFRDRDNLPYVNALLKETLRWQIITPIGKPLLRSQSEAGYLTLSTCASAIPHATVNDDQYRGFFVPAKTIVIANSWYVRCTGLNNCTHQSTTCDRAILNDPAMYPSPESFQPERFLHISADGVFAPNTDLLDPRAVIFGFGRRACPGRNIAENLFFAAAASLLATMDFTQPTDEHGGCASMQEKWTPGIMHALTSFECTIRPRDEQAIRLVRESVEAGEGR